jgi:hypothetical protein
MKFADAQRPLIGKPVRLFLLGVALLLAAIVAYTALNDGGDAQLFEDSIGALAGPDAGR